MTTRLPKELAKAVRQRAEDNDVSFSDEIGNTLAASLGLPPVAAPPAKQGQIKLPA